MHALASPTSSWHILPDSLTADHSLAQLMLPPEHEALVGYALSCGALTVSVLSDMQAWLVSRCLCQSYERVRGSQAPDPPIRVGVRLAKRNIQQVVLHAASRHQHAASALLGSCC